MKIKYGIIVLENNYNGFVKDTQIKILHFCGYEEKPDEEAKKALEEELNTDEEFGLVGRINKDVFLFDAPSDIVKIYAKEISYVTK